jgi:hypothetical protein
VKKLYEIEITVRAVVLAESREDAYSVAYACKREIMTDSEVDYDVGNELVKGCRLPSDWNGGCYPYGRGYGEPEMMIKQIWEDQE